MSIGQSDGQSHVFNEVGPHWKGEWSVSLVWAPRRRHGTLQKVVVLIVVSLFSGTGF